VPNRGADPRRRDAADGNDPERLHSGSFRCTSGNAGAFYDSECFKALMASCVRFCSGMSSASTSCCARASRSFASLR